MLRPELEKRPTCPQTAQDAWRVSSGSAAVLGLSKARLDAAPTTVYLMLGDRCQRNCAFCTQARHSGARQSALSRVSWPHFQVEAITDATAVAFACGDMLRACFQVTVGPLQIDTTIAAVSQLASCTPIPICVSAAPSSLDDVTALLDAGAERVTISLDAATPDLYKRVKGGSWSRTHALLLQAAETYPGHISTHLIVGLGESEQEIISRITDLHARGILIGLFAFTPIAGTRMASQPPPSIQSYRRIQAAHWLIINGLAASQRLRYDLSGRLVSFGMPAEELRLRLDAGQAFRTAGCPGCNRPYYNERPGGTMYNYPRSLSRAEADAEIGALVAHLDRF